MKSAEMDEIRPGLSVDVVISTDFAREITDVRRAIIYETSEDKKITISQTNPPLTRFYVNKGVTVTFFTRQKGKLIRAGYFGKVVDILQYRLQSGETVHATVIALKSGLDLFDLRMHFRVRPTSDSNMRLYYLSEQVPIIDISIGGIRFSHKKKFEVNPGDIIKITIEIEREKFPTELKILRVWSSYTDRRQHEIEYVSGQFLLLDKRLNYLLGGKIFEIQRESRAKENPM
ncbi:MAG TPA: PilZ domain-containing protein [Syntrophales bacterium]|nr:PilZ domain-containing protein [Syntrophales bacterium]